MIRSMLQPDLLCDFLKRAQNGDPQAVDELLVLLRPHLDQLARRYRDPSVAADSTADLVQEAALRIWQKLGQFRGEEDTAETAAMFVDWVSQIVRHLALDRYRERHALCRQPPQGVLRLQSTAPGDATAHEAGIGPAAREPTPSANVRSDEQVQLVQKALANIADDTEREIVRLCFFEGLSLRQIAERLDLSYDKVRERYHRSLKRLERELKGLL
jgi:RNA polymerase sigma-70 factor, ECF subfamily